MRVAISGYSHGSVCALDMFVDEPSTFDDAIIMSPVYSLRHIDRLKSLALESRPRRAVYLSCGSRESPCRSANHRLEKLFLKAEISVINQVIGGMGHESKLWVDEFAKGLAWIRSESEPK